MYEYCKNNIIIGYIKKEKENTWYYCYACDAVPQWYGHYRTKKQAEDLLLKNCAEFYNLLKRAFND